MDSKVVVNNSNSKTSSSVSGSRSIQHIVRMLEIDWEIRMCHSYREANHCVNAFVNVGYKGEKTTLVFY
jgi:hypothetical protein